MSKTFKAVIAVILVAILGVGLYFFISAQINNQKKCDFSNPTGGFDTPGFVQLLKPENTDGITPPARGWIVKVEFDGYKWYGYTSTEGRGSSYTYWTVGPSVYHVDLSIDSSNIDLSIDPSNGSSDEASNESGVEVSVETGRKNFIRQLEERGIVVSFSDPDSGNTWGNILYIGILIIGVIAFFMILRATSGGGGKVMNFGKTKAKISTNIKVRFSDVAGAEEEKEELQEVVEFLKNPKKFSNLGAKIPKGVLLVGRPGTGKTLFAKAVAGEAGVPFFSVSGSDFVEMYVGVGASRVRDLFDLAKRNQPCIIFIDEIDAVGRQRGAGLGGGHDEREQTLNQILVQMDGFESNEGVIVMAATNRADILDNALLRPGRFDRQIYVHLPDVKGREAILKVHARNKPLAADVNFKIIARITSGFSGADLANLLNEAAILAARAGKSTIGNHEIYEGINKVILGPQKKSRVVTEADKKNTAYHEAGHAILAKLCEHCDEVQEVSIIPRGMAAGYTLSRPETDDRKDTVNKLNDEICMALGGRVAEELVIHDFSAGAAGDIKAITRDARRMVTEWGMSERLGPICYSSDGPVFLGRDYEERATYSEETAAVIDQEVKRIIGMQYVRAKRLLAEHRSILDNMARVLVERETIYTAEVNMLMKGAGWEEVLAYMEEHDKETPDNPFGLNGNENAAEGNTEDKPEDGDNKSDKE